MGKYPTDFNQGDPDGLALSRGRMIPTSPWDAMWKGVAEWFGIEPDSWEMDKVLPMHKNFPANILYNETDLFVAPSLTPASAPPPVSGSPAPNKAPTAMQQSSNLFE